MKKIIYLFLGFFSIGLYAQSVDCRFIPSEDPCDNGQYCVNLQIKSDDGADYIGTSSIRISYNDDVLQFSGNQASGVSVGSYTSINFDDLQNSINSECDIANGGIGITPYSTHGFDGLVPGDILITLVLVNPSIGATIYACPAIDTDWEDVSTICFEVLNSYGNPEIEFMGTENGPVLDDAGTNFNPDNNSPLDKYDNGSFTGINDPFDLLCGGVASATSVAFNDENNNGLLDSEESPLANQAFAVNPQNILSYTNIDGNTTFILEANAEYTIQWLTDPLWSVSGNTNISFSTFGDYDETFYFPMTPNASVVSHELDLSSSITRCNWEVNYWLTYSNTGTTNNSGYVFLVPDELTTYLTANPAPDSTAGDTLYWFYENLAPTYSEQIIAQFQMPDVNSLGEDIGFSAEIETWEGAGNRKTEIASELICAYDPNDKLVSPELYGGDDKNYTLFNDSLEYTIRFQNTGNDTAFTVFVSDELDANLDLSTFRVIASSHEVATSIDIDTRVATFLFEDIYLADSFVNEPASHGFVKYRILANEGLAESTIVDNTAGIYFDLNDPIITNTVANTMVSTLPTFPMINTSSSDLDFGYVAVGETATQTLTILNSGDLTLEINEIISESTEFSVLNNPYTIEGGGEINIEISFTPTQEIPYIGNLILKSNSGNLPVNLQGIGGTNTGIQNLDWRLSVAPNPSNGLFELNWLDENGWQNATLQVYDVNGKIVLTQEMNGNKSRLDLSGQLKGVYYLHLQNEQNNIVKKLLIQ